MAIAAIARIGCSAAFAAGAVWAYDSSFAMESAKKECTINSYAPPNQGGLEEKRQQVREDLDARSVPQIKAKLEKMGIDVDAAEQAVEAELKRSMQERQKLEDPQDWQKLEAWQKFLFKKLCAVYDNMESKFRMEAWEDINNLFKQCRSETLKKDILKRKALEKARMLHYSVFSAKKRFDNWIGRNFGNDFPKNLEHMKLPELVNVIKAMEAKTKLRNARNASKDVEQVKKFVKEQNDILSELKKCKPNFSQLPKVERKWRSKLVAKAQKFLHKKHVNEGQAFDSECTICKPVEKPDSSQGRQVQETCRSRISAKDVVDGASFCLPCIPFCYVSTKILGDMGEKGKMEAVDKQFKQMVGLIVCFVIVWFVLWLICHWCRIQLC